MAKPNRRNQEGKQICFFIVAALVIYEREEVVKQRTINVMIEAENPNMTKAVLGHIQQAALNRVHSENGVTPDLVKDVVILTISLLGQMTAEEFHGKPVEALDEQVM